MSKTKKTIRSEIEEVDHEIVMENARHSDESLRLTRRLDELYVRLREAECLEMAATAAEQEYENWLKANVPPEAHEGLGHDLSCENLLCRDSASPEDGKWTPTEVQAEWLRHFFNRWMDMERREGQS